MNLRLDFILNLPGKLTLGEDLERTKDYIKDLYFYNPTTMEYEKKIKKYSRKFIIQVTGKKVRRKYEFFVQPDRKPDSFFLIYILNNKSCLKETAPVLENENGDFVFNLTDFLRNKHIDYDIPKYERLSYESVLRMNRCSVTLTNYGAIGQCGDGRIGFDGTGNGYDYYLFSDYLTYNKIAINHLHINSYNVTPIHSKVKEFLKCPREISKEELRQLLRLVCSGNEIGLSTDHIDIYVSRHYSSAFKVTAFGKILNLCTPVNDHKHSINPDQELLENVEDFYSVIIQKLIVCDSYDEVEEILSNFYTMRPAMKSQA